MDFSGIVGFDWDDDNLYKNIERHNVYDVEAEQVFFHHPLVLREERYFALGRSNNERLLFISFTLRKDMIRIISARDMTKREVRVYENYHQRNS